MKVLITGGTGYLGRAVVGAIQAAGHATTVFARSATASGLRGVLVDGDIRDSSHVMATAVGCDAIVHIAALVAVWRKQARQFDEVNVGGLVNVLDAARHHRIRRVVYTSSFLALPPGGADQSPAWNDYQRTKSAADRLAHAAAQHGAPIVTLYPGVIYGPGMLSDGNLVGRLIADHLAGRLPGLVGAGRIWSFAYVDDVAAAHVAALDRGRFGQRYLLGGEDAPPMRVFELVQRLTGHPLPRRLPAWVAAGAALADELRVSWFGGIPRLTTGTLEILLHDWPLGCVLAQEELGYRVTPLDEGISRVIASLAKAPQAGGQPAET